MKKILSLLLALALSCVALIGCENLLQSSSSQESTSSSANAKEYLAFELNYAKNAYYVTGLTDSSIQDVLIPETYNDLPVTTILERAFKDTAIKSVSIPDSVESIRDRAFSGCTLLNEVSLSKSLTSISEWTFAGCTSLKSIEIPRNIRYIYDSAFRSSGLVEIHLPNVSSIGNNAFAECAYLRNITVSDNLTYIGGYAFYDTEWYDNQSNGPLYLGNILYEYKGAMPENHSFFVKEGTIGISPYAVRFQPNLKNVVLPSSLRYISYCAFQDCSSLFHINIPANVQMIYYQAFINCSSLIKIVIPKNVSIESEVFKGCDILTIYTYETSLETAQWSETFNPDNRPIYFKGEWTE